MPDINDVTYAEQLKPLFSAMTAATGYKLILGLQLHDKPVIDMPIPDPGESPNEPTVNHTQYPYYGYNILSQQRVANIPYEEQRVDEVYRWWNEQYEVALSIVAVSLNPFEAQEVARKLYAWMTNVGKDILYNLQIAHVSSTLITSRDFMLVNNYEYRAGFDARLRMGRQVAHTVPRIETVNIQPGEILN